MRFLDFLWASDPATAPPGGCRSMNVSGREAPRRRCRVAASRVWTRTQLLDTCAVVSWGELRSARPELAEGGRALLYQFGVGLAFLGTVARDGRPRVNPVCPLRHGRRHVRLRGAGPEAGRPRCGTAATRCTRSRAPTTRTPSRSVAGPRLSAMPRPGIGWPSSSSTERADIGLGLDALANQLLFRFDLERCMLTRTTGHGDPSPVHTIWTA